MHKVMRAERVLKAATLDVRLVPVPRQLSSDCGLALEFMSTDRDRAVQELEAAGCPFEELHLREAGGYRRAE